MSNNTIATQASCPSGRPRKKRKKSKHEDEPFVKDGGNNADSSGSASRQAQQTEDGSSGSNDGVVIGLYDAAGQGGAGGPGGAGVGSQVSETRNVAGKEMGDGILTQSSAAGGASE
ncbi:hypothetical protein Tco_1041924 [Tanacetum coccineum]|uniref:Uncharacterized protein n=1 Tax=Tanacetum coccineum TaxID=301880 RepID=A0ABQ5GJ39_9ASTR